MNPRGGLRTNGARRDRLPIGTPRAGDRGPFDPRRSAVDETTGRKPYTLPLPCGQRMAHVCRTGFYHCNLCFHDRPRWDFYTDRTTGEMIAGCRDCRVKRARQPRERIPSVAELIDGPPRRGRPPARALRANLGPTAEILNSLPAPYREVMIGYYVDGKTLKGLSAELAITYDAARTRCRRARKLLGPEVVDRIRAARKSTAA